VFDRFNIRAALRHQWQRHPGLRAIAACGAGTPWSHLVMDSAQKKCRRFDERADIAKTTDVIQAFTGRRRRMAWAWLTETWDTPDILARGY